MLGSFNCANYISTLLNTSLNLSDLSGMFLPLNVISYIFSIYSCFVSLCAFTIVGSILAATFSSKGELVFIVRPAQQRRIKVSSWEILSWYMTASSESLNEQIFEYITFEFISKSNASCQFSFSIWYDAFMPSMYAAVSNFAKLSRHSSLTFIN